jgi:ppGpp synthetase/RelA/SpoT-type nucleotidyltranferase
VQSRVKQWHSIEAKLERVDLKLQGLLDLQDLVGIRVILIFRRDLQRVKALIENHFDVVRQYDTGARLKQDQFGYSSLHFVVKAKREWLCLPTFANVGDLQAEIQIRTVAQHIWARASEELQYKREADIPSEMLRGIYRVAALLETVDLEFERVLEQRERYRSTVNVSGTQSLDVDSLEVVLDELLPRENKDGRENLAELLEVLSNVGIGTPSKLQDLWSEYGTDVLRRQAEIMVKSGDRLVESMEDWVKQEVDNSDRAIALEMLHRFRNGVLWNHFGLISAAIKLRNGEDPAEL